MRRALPGLSPPATNTVAVLAGSYVLVVLILSLASYTPFGRSDDAGFALHLLTLPTSVILYPFIAYSLIGVGMTLPTTEGYLWIPAMLFWVLIGAVQAVIGVAAVAAVCTARLLLCGRAPG